jgi:hypothetical protein
MNPAGTRLLRPLRQSPVCGPQLDPFLRRERQIVRVMGFGVAKPVGPAKRPLVQVGRRCQAAHVQGQHPAHGLNGKIGGQPPGDDCLSQDSGDFVFQENGCE